METTISGICIVATEFKNVQTALTKTAAKKVSYYIVNVIKRSNIMNVKNQCRFFERNQVEYLSLHLLNGYLLVYLRYFWNT